jgi:anti-sigma regulatory factor (Ser/Thr protein kinase)
VPTTVLTLNETVSPSAIGFLRRETAAAVAEAGVDDALIPAIRLCVSEAVTNAAMHAYRDDSGVVEVLVEVDADEVVVTVLDAGCGLGGAPDQRGREGGLGMQLIGKLTDNLRVTSESGRGTEICMAFARGAKASSAVRFLSP